MATAQLSIGDAGVLVRGREGDCGLREPEEDALCGELLRQLVARVEGSPLLGLDEANHLSSRLLDAIVEVAAPAQAPCAQAVSRREERGRVRVREG